MKDLVIITLGVIAGFPTLIGIVSFITWENGFRILGRNYIMRAIVALIVFAWIIYFIPRGAA